MGHDNKGLFGAHGGLAVTVTGGSSGIGRAVCVALAAEGASVAVVGRDRIRVNAVVEEIRDIGPSSSHIGVVGDVTDETQMARMAGNVMEGLGRIDALVSCAGIGRSSLSERVFPLGTHELPLDEWDEVVTTNLTGVFLSNRAVLPAMLKAGKGTIINISSFPAGVSGQPYAPAYSASKFGVIGFSESLMEEVGPQGIKVHVMLPGLTATPMTSHSALASRIGVPLEPALVADMVVFMLGLPEDTLVEKPIILPFKTRRRKKK